MRFIIDESTGQAVVEYLRAAGHDVQAVAEIMLQAADINILQYALADDRIVITNDKDFGELVFRSGQSHAGIVLLRLDDERPATRVRVIAAVLVDHAERLHGSFTVATEANIRVRPAR